MEHGKEWPLVPSKTVANSGAQFIHAEVLPANFPDATPITAQQFHCAVEMRWSGWGTFKAVLSHGLSPGTWINHSSTIAVSKYCPVWDWTLCLVALSPGRGPETLGSNNVTSLMHGYENDHLKLHSLTHKIRKINYPFVYFTLIIWWVCAYMLLDIVYVQAEERREFLGISSLLPPCTFQVLKLNIQVPLPSESSCPSCFSSLLLCEQTTDLFSHIESHIIQADLILAK